MTIATNVLDMIGNTPILEASKLDTGCCRLFLKLENQNPGGSIKDRIALTMIESAEQSRKLKPGATIVEGTAGNTGIALALVAAQKRYQLILVVPDKMSREKIFNLKAMGAEVILTRSDVAKGHPEYYQDLAQKIADETPGAFFINQFGNPDNPKAHYQTTAPEIWQQMQSNLDAIVCGVGSSGTITGLSKYFSEVAPELELVLADPVGSILANYINHGELSTKSKTWLVEGIGEDFLPSISDFSRVTKAYAITDKESFDYGRQLLLTEGVFGGSSTGTNIAAALKYCQEQTKPKNVLTFVCDTGNKYLSKMYDDQWMFDNGFITRKQYGDLRDVVSNKFDDHEVISIGPTEILQAALKKMRQNGISQLPVMQDNALIGEISEKDLLKVSQNDKWLQQSVESVINKDIKRLKYNDSVTNLTDCLSVTDIIYLFNENNQFYGLITKADWLSYLQRQE